MICDIVELFGFALLTFLLGILLSYGTTKQCMEKRAANAGVAHYVVNPTNGVVSFEYIQCK